MEPSDFIFHHFELARVGCSDMSDEQKREMLLSFKSWRKLTVCDYSTDGKSKLEKEGKENEGRDEEGRRPGNKFYGMTEEEEHEAREGQVLCEIRREMRDEQLTCEHKERKAKSDLLHEKMQLGGVNFQGKELGPGLRDRQLRMGGLNHSTLMESIG